MFTSKSARALFALWCQKELMHFERKIEKHKYLRSEMSASRDRALPAADGKAKLIHDNKLLQKVEDYGKLVRVLMLYCLEPTL